MGRVLLKCDPNVDLYIEWSTVVDAPTAVGTRAQFEKEMNIPKRGEEFMTEEAIRIRMDRVNKHGTSRLGDDDGNWDDKGLLYRQGPKPAFLPRKNFLAYGQMLLKDPNAQPDGLTEPLEDD
jgi:hypothetical protein